MGFFDSFKHKPTLEELHAEHPEMCFEYLQWEQIEMGGTMRWCLRCTECGRKRGNTYHDKDTGQLRYAWDHDFGSLVKIGAPSGRYPEYERPLMKLFYDKFPDADEPNEEEARLAQERVEAHIRKMDALFESKRQENLAKPHCPTCGSTDVQPISTVKRVASTAVMGIASSTIGKSYECKKCGYKW